MSGGRDGCDLEQGLSPGNLTVRRLIMAELQLNYGSCVAGCEFCQGSALVMESMSN